MPSAYRFETDAETEYFDGIRHYAREAGDEVADRFVATIADALDAICAAPDRWRVFERPDIRRYVLPRFPYVILYRWQEAENLVVIYAVMHTSRRPGYWRERLPGAAG